MSVSASGAAFAWKRWLPGSNVILFLLLSAGFWMASIASDAAGQPILVVAFLAVAAFFPLAWLGMRLWTRPLWAVQVRGDPEAVASAVHEAVRDRLPTQLAAADAPEGLFRRCEMLLRIDEPACFLGLERAHGGRGMTVLLLPRSRDRRSVDGLRARITSRLSGI